MKKRNCSDNERDSTGPCWNIKVICLEEKYIRVTINDYTVAS